MHCILERVKHSSLWEAELKALYYNTNVTYIKARYVKVTYIKVTYIEVTHKKYISKCYTHT